MEVQEQACWLLLTFKCGLSVRIVNQIVKSWCQQSNRTLSEFFAADVHEWNALCHVDDKVVSKLELLRQSDTSSQASIVSLVTEQVAVVKQLANDSIQLLTLLDERYPRLLTCVSGENQRPPMLFYRGDLRILDRVAIAIIGSRNACESSLAFTSTIAHHLSQQGANVISGNARGVDRTAYESATSADDGCTTLVLPHGIHKVSKTQMHDLQPRIEAGNVLLLSQFHPDAPWVVSRAMERNTVVTGLAQIVIVAESDSKGGTWEGANGALKQGRRVYVRQSDDAKLLPGNRLLLEKGGYPLPWPTDTITDILAPLLRESSLMREKRQATPPLPDQLSLMAGSHNEELA